MSEEKNKVTQVVRTDDKDWFLQSLVNMVNGGEIRFGITLNVGGFLVSGTLIGGKEYFEGFGEDFSSGFGDTEAAKGIKAVFAKNGENYSTQENTLHLSYIHIKDARCFNSNGNPIPGNKGVWWRGKLSTVDGFSLGELSAENS